MTGVSPTKCNPGDTEADTDLRVIEPLLRGSNYLEVPTHDIKGKGYLPPIKLDKAARKSKGYFPDFSVWRKTPSLLIVEAKAPSVASEIGYREASLYAGHLNQLYAHNVNPCQLIISTNGLKFLAGYWDTTPKFEFDIEELIIGSAKLQVGIREAVGWLRSGPLAARVTKIVVSDDQGTARIRTLDELAAAAR